MKNYTLSDFMEMEIIRLDNGDSELIIAHYDDPEHPEWLGLPITIAVYQAEGMTDFEIREEAYYCFTELKSCLRERNHE